MPCPKCQGILKLEGDYWVCQSCPYRRERIKPMPTYEDLLQENIKLRHIIKRVDNYFDDKLIHPLSLHRDIKELLGGLPETR